MEVQKGGGVMGKRGVAMIALVAAVLAVVGCGGGSGEEGGSAHVNEGSGSTHGLIRDEREGTPLPPPKSTNLKKLADAANCFLLLGYREQKPKDLPPGADTPKYHTDPPSSGPHVEPPYQQADGAYMVEPDPINVVGALDNGRMAIAYAPDLNEKIQLELKGLYDTMYGGTLLFPDDDMQFALVATTWSNVLGCTGIEGPQALEVVRAFGKATWGKYGSNPVDSLPVEGPTPADPETTAGSE
jgi:hypothetical protein